MGKGDKCCMTGPSPHTHDQAHHRRTRETSVLASMVRHGADVYGRCEGRTRVRGAPPMDALTDARGRAPTDAPMYA